MALWVSECRCIRGDRDGTNPTQSPRAQMDRVLYRTNMQGTLNNYPNLDVRAGSVFDLVFDVPPSLNGPPSRIVGVKLGMSPIICCFDLAHIVRLWRRHTLLSGRDMHRHLLGWRDPHRAQTFPCWTYGRSAVNRPVPLSGRSRLQTWSLTDRNTRATSEGQHRLLPDA